MLSCTDSDELPMATSKLNLTQDESLPPNAAHGTGLKTGEAVHGSDGVSKEEILTQLDRILASPSFKHSRRHTQFLRFVVEGALSGRHFEFKERLIGIEVFGRPSDYDLAADAIVRGAAVELRKRIAQYYAEPDHASELRVELPLGTYAPVFYWPNPAHKEKQDLAAFEDQINAVEEALSPPANHAQRDDAGAVSALSMRMIAVVTGCAIVFVAIGAFFAARSFMTHSPQRSLDAFWAPLMNEGNSITVCVGDLNYMFETPPLNKVLEVHPTADNLLNPNAGAALLRVGIILGSRGKRTTLRFADRTELNDLRQQPVIFIGGMNNPWTQRILAGMRFRLLSTPSKPYGTDGTLTDEKNPALKTWSVALEAPLSSITRDYSLVTRMNDPLTGEPVLILCGLGPYGTAAASEFVSDPNYFSEFSKQAPKGWENRDIQIVLETTVVNGRVSVPRVVAEQVY